MSFVCVNTVSGRILLNTNQISSIKDFKDLDTGAGKINLIQIEMSNGKTFDIEMTIEDFVEKLDTELQIQIEDP